MWPVIKDVLDQPADLRITYLASRDGDGFGRGVDDGNGLRERDELGSPVTRSSSELENVSEGSEGCKDDVELRYLRFPAQPIVLAQVVLARSAPPVVIPRCVGPVVVDLAGQKVIDAWAILCRRQGFIIRYGIPTPRLVFDPVLSLSELF